MSYINGSCNNCYTGQGSARKSDHMNKDSLGAYGIALSMQPSLYSDIGGSTYRIGFDSPELRDSYISLMSGKASNPPPYDSSGKCMSSIDDLLKYEQMKKPALPDNSGSYPIPEARLYTKGQYGDFGEHDADRLAKGYGVNSRLDLQFGMRGSKG